MAKLENVIDRIIDSADVEQEPTPLTVRSFATDEGENEVFGIPITYRGEEFVALKAVGPSLLIALKVGDTLPAQVYFIPDVRQ